MKIDIDIPDGKSGDWSVETFEVSKEAAEFENMRAMFSYSARTIDPGTYKKLKRNGTIVMSNTPVEIDDFRRFVSFAHGDILVNGLGLGVLLKALLNKPEDKSVTVIEKSEDVIKLVAPYIKDKRVKIIHADAFTWKPPKIQKYDYVWHDIWDNICSDNLVEMSKLHRKYGKRTEHQYSWCREKCERNRYR
jgi:hypothetical protein